MYSVFFGWSECNSDLRNRATCDTSTKRNLTKGAFTLKFYAFYAFKVYTNSPEFHLVLVRITTAHHA